MSRVGGWLTAEVLEFGDEEEEDEQDGLQVAVYVN